MTNKPKLKYKLKDSETLPMIEVSADKCCKECYSNHYLPLGCDCSCHKPKECKHDWKIQGGTKDNPDQFEGCIKCGEVRAYHEGKKQSEWAEFDKRFINGARLGGEYAKKTGEEIKNYIRQNFISKREVEKKLEGMKKIPNYPTVDHEHEVIIAEEDGYNQALEDILKLLETK